MGQPTEQSRPSKACILLAVQTYPDGGGIARIVENFVHALERRYDVHLAVVEPRSGRYTRLSLASDRIHELGYSNLINPLLAPFSFAFLARTAVFLRRLVARLQPRLLIVQDGLNLPVPGALAVHGRPTKLIVMDHGTLTNVLDRDWQELITGRLPPAKRALFRLSFAADRPWREVRWRIGLRLADAAWYTGEELRPYFAHAGERARVYAQVLPSDFQEPDATARDRARHAFKLGPEHTAVNMVTRLDGEKGLSSAVDAIEQQASRHDNLRVLIAGDGSLRSWLADTIESRGLGGVVLLLGAMDRRAIAQLHHASDFHLYTGTIGCGMSVALLEAMSCGVIPIVSDVPAAQRDLVDGAGWVFPAGDDAALRAALTAALNTTPQMRVQLRAEVRRQLTRYGEPSISSLVDRAVELA